MKSTIRIPKDRLNRHHITIPIELWQGEGLTEGDLIEIDIKKLETIGRKHDGRDALSRLGLAEQEPIQKGEV